MQLTDCQYAIGLALRQHAGASNSFDFEFQEEVACSDTDLDRILRASFYSLLVFFPSQKSQGKVKSTNKHIISYLSNR